MSSEKFFEKVKKQLGLKHGDNVLHVYKENTIFSKLLVDAVGKEGKVYAVDMTSMSEKVPKENIFFHTISDNLNLKTGSIDVIFLEDTIYHLTDFYDSLSGIRKYLSRKGKIAINQINEMPILNLIVGSKKKKLNEAMYIAGFRLKNKFRLNNRTYLEIFEKE
jgi:ubiquinone/menaquinone biosynthesis C-methylase UbiE